MKKIIEWSFQNRAAMIVVVTLVLALGTLSYFILPMEFLPEADNPQVVVATLGEGHDASSMEQTVTAPVEAAVSAVKGKKDVLSETGDGYSQVRINFSSDTDMKEAAQEVKEALSTLTLPEGISKPNVVQLNTSMIPLSQVSFSFADGLTEENMEKVEKEILPQFQNLEGVAGVSLYGKVDPRIVIQPDKKKMEKYQLPLESLTGMLEGQNFAVSAGEKSIDGKMSNIKVSGDLENLDALRNMVIPNPVPEAPTLRLKDVAKVEQKMGQESVTHINGEEALALMVTKDGNSSAVDVAKEVEKVVKQVNADHQGIKTRVMYSTSDMVENSVNSMMQEVLLGALFATMVIMLFLRNLRATLITIVSIPLSLGMTLILLWLSGVTLNILTLGGVAVSIGRLVDDSIVVVENIFRRIRTAGGLTKQTVVDATAEVGKAITSSTLVTVAVFLPMGLIDGSLRSFLLPFGLTVTYSLLTSLLVAVTVVPLMSSRLFQSSKHKEKHQPERYLRLLKWSLNHKFVPILTAIVVFVGSIALYMVMPKGTISAEDASMVNITMDYPSDTSVAKVKEEAQDLEEKLLKMEGYSDIFFQVGNSEDAAQWGEVGSPTQASLSIILKEGANADKWIDAVKKEKKNYPDADLTVSAASMMSADSSVITYDVMGEEEEKLEEISDKLISAIKGVEGVKKVSSNQDEKKPVYSVVVDTSKGNTQQTAMELRMLLNETPIGTVRMDNRDTSVYLNADVDPSSKEDLNKLQLTTPEGMVPLSKVASIEKEELSSTRFHKDGNPYIRVSAEIDPEKLSVISQELGQKVGEIKLPKGVKIETGGASEEQISDFIDLGLTMLASIGIVYLIMVITFRSLRAPIAILMSIPLASIGSVLGLLITGVPVDATALIGGLMLIGVVVTNAIVLVDRIKQNEAAMTIREAIVEASGTRLRPILMTAIATICAMFPLLFGDSEDGSLVSKGLAVVVIGGLAVSTALTLVIVPVFYELLHFRKSKKQRRQLEQSQQESV